MNLMSTGWSQGSIYAIAVLFQHEHVEGVLWGRRLPDHLPLNTQRPCGCSGSLTYFLYKMHGAVKLILGRAALLQGQ